MKDGLSNKQFLTIAFIIVICGIAILGHDYFLAKKTKVYEEMSIVLSQEPQVVEPVPDEPDTTEVVSTNTNTNSNSNNDPSGRVKKVNTTYNYVGRLQIPDIGLNRGFLRYGQRGNNVDQNVAIMGGSQYPDVEGSNFILAAHSGNGWNAYFGKLDRLKTGAMAYITYNGKQYSYKLNKIYSDRKSDKRITVYPNENKQLTLVTCKRPDYKKYYLVLVFDIVNETDL